jgi:hypothetical protein
VFTYISTIGIPVGPRLGWNLVCVGKIPALCHRTSNFELDIAIFQKEKDFMPYL